MRKVLVLFIALSLFSCKKDNKGLLDPNATVSIRPAAGVKAYDRHLTAEEIVHKTSDIAFMTFHNPEKTHWAEASRGFADHQRDFENMRLLMYSTDVVAQNGTLEEGFIEGRDIVLRILDQRLEPIDTIAYISNSIIIQAEKEIRAAYAAEDYETCYRLFDNAFVFQPITGAEWRALKEQGLQ